MTHRIKDAVIAAFLVGAMSACVSSPVPNTSEGGPVYVAVALGELAARPQVSLGVLPTDLNDSGQAVGTSNGRAFLWTAAAGMTDLGSLPGEERSFAAAISPSGVVVGQTDVAGYLWSADAGMRELASEDPFVSEPHAVNAAGFVVGAVASEGLWVAAQWSADGVLRMRDFIGIGNDVNESWVIAGELHGPGGPYAATWTAEGAPLVIPLAEDETGRAVAVNASGAVAGERELASDPFNAQPAKRAFVWTREDGMRDLGAPPNTPASEGQITPHDINDGGEIVGEAAGAAGSFAFLWDAAHGLRDLNDFISFDAEGGPQPVLQSAVAINNRGEILAYSWGTTGATAYLLRPLDPAQDAE